MWIKIDTLEIEIYNKLLTDEISGGSGGADVPMCAD